MTLTSGAKAQYYVDAKRAILLPAGFAALGELVAEHAARVGRDRRRRADDGRRPVACAALAGGADVKAFFVRKETKAHGLQRRDRGPLLEPGDRCLIVEDVVTTGGSTSQAIEAVRARGPRDRRRRRDPRPARRRRGGDPGGAAARRTCRWRRSTTSTRTAPTGLTAPRPVVAV